MTELRAREPKCQLCFTGEKIIKCQVNLSLFRRAISSCMRNATRLCWSRKPVRILSVINAHGWFRRTKCNASCAPAMEGTFCLCQLRITRIHPLVFSTSHRHYLGWPGFEVYFYLVTSGQVAHPFVLLRSSLRVPVQLLRAICLRIALDRPA